MRLPDVLTLGDRPAAAPFALAVEPIAGIYTDCLFAWMSGDLAVPMRGGPDGQGFVDRFGAALETIAADHWAGATSTWPSTPSRRPGRSPCSITGG